MDIQILLWLQNLRNPVFNAINFAITLLADEAVLLVLLCGMYWCWSKRNAAFLAFNFFAGMVVNSFLKITCCVPRPWVRDARIVPYGDAIESATGYSFPSGHTACGTAVYGGFALLAKKKWLSWAMVILAVLIGFSRMYLGVHTPQDVLVSLAVGFALLFAVRKGLDEIEKRPGLDVRVLLGGLVLAAALALYAGLKPYPADATPELIEDTYKTAGALMGMLLGWFMERRFVKFDEKAVIFWQIVKVIGGIAGILAVKALLKPVFVAVAGDAVGGMLRYCLMVLWAIWLWPALFVRFAKPKA